MDFDPTVTVVVPDVLDPDAVVDGAELAVELGAELAVVLGAEPAVVETGV